MLTLLPTPIGNLQDITLRTIEVLNKSDVIICEDTRVVKKLLNLLKEKLDIIIDYNKKEFISYHSHTKNIDFKDKLKNKNCVYLSDAGMPCVSDPGAKLVQFCIEEDIKYDALPGASATLLAYSLSGFEDKEFFFYGFLPHKKDRIVELEKILNKDVITIVYESTHRIEKLIDEIYNLDNDRVVFMAKELTKKNQFFIKDKICNIKSLNLDYRGEWVIVIDKSNKIEPSLSKNQILYSDIPPKIKAKLLSKLTNKSVKDIYKDLINN